MPYVNWAEVFAWLPSCPPGKAKEQLGKLAASKVRVKTPKAKIRLPRGAKAKVKVTPLPKLKKELDRLFSIWARTRDIDENGIATCVTCGRRDHWKNMDAGHYVPRQDMSTRWHEFNVWPQCRPDNAFRGGEPEKMAAYIDKRVGFGIAAFLRDLARKPFKPARQWYENQIRIYKARIGEGGALGERSEPSNPVTSK